MIGWLGPRIPNRELRLNGMADCKGGGMKVCMSEQAFTLFGILPLWVGMKARYSLLLRHSF